MESILGIDLGTTNSEVAIIKNGKPEIITIDGEKLMPSCVALDKNNKLIVGRVAKNQMAVNAASTVMSIKRKMGSNEKISLGDKSFSPEEISSFILKKLAQSARKHIGHNVTKAVITVPAYFDNTQRKATKNAGTLAGLDVVRIINEPTAAALAYEHNHEENRNILVYDLGGGTFDVSVVVVENGVVEVKASHGDTSLGGDDFDNLLIDHIANNFIEKHSIDLREDLTSKYRLWAAVEKAKRELSNSPIVKINEEFISGDLHLSMEISQDLFNNLISNLIEKTMNCVHKTLKDSQFLPGAIDTIILAGGSTRSPIIAKKIQEIFRKSPVQAINPDLIVTLGAAIQGGVIAGCETHSVLVDITPYSFGTSAAGEIRGDFIYNKYIPILNRNTPIPVEKSDIFTTMVDEQQSVDVRVFQGEKPIADENTLIGDFLIENLSDVPAGNRIQLKLKLDLNGILDVTAEELDTGLTKTVRMETSGETELFDINKAMKNISDVAIETIDDTDEYFDTTENNETLTKAKSLRKRAESLINSLDKVDANEINDLLNLSRSFISSNDMTKLDEINESLSDMLFYLED